MKKLLAMLLLAVPTLAVAQDQPSLAEQTKPAASTNLKEREQAPT
jgi:hypothetical protein